jgi:dihydroxyacetone kinase-like protein
VLSVTVKRELVLAWLDALQRVYAENKDRLTELDSAIGDADHGINMERGFKAVRVELAADAPADIRGILQKVAAVLIRTVGGASGPLYGTFFLRAAAAAAGAELDVLTFLQAGVEGVRQRGKAEPGDKTMLDALIPAVEAMRTGGLDAAAAAAEAGMLATIPMQASKGRASYLGARSVGHQDPGATSAWLLIRTAAEIWRA